MRKEIYIVIFMLLSFSITLNTLNAQTIWDGPDVTFTRAADVDWTLVENQDSLTEHVIFARQDAAQIYNYKWWQEMFGVDPTTDWDTESDLAYEFWGDFAIPTQTFNPSGGTQGVRWAILSDLGADNPWDVTFDMYATLGDPTHFYSFHNIATMITQLNVGAVPIACPDSFSVELENGNFPNGTQMTELVGKDLACWIRDENIYFTLSFSDWGSGGTGSFAYTRSSGYDVTFNIDMNQPITDATFVVGTDQVYVAGSSWGWTEPGTNANYELFDADTDGIYSGTYPMGAADYEYKYFQNAGWDGGEWTGGDNRAFSVVDADVTLNDLWGDPNNSISTLNSSISIYPNPSNGTFSVNVENNLNLEVFDIAGKIIHTRTLSGNTIIELNTAGVYFLRFSNTEGSLTKRVVVQ